MPDHHYHANHIDAPARGSKRVALKDARRLHVELDREHRRDPRGAVGAAEIREHGVEFPLIVRCHRPDCRIVREGER